MSKLLVDDLFKDFSQASFPNSEAINRESLFQFLKINIEFAVVEASTSWDSHLKVRRKLPQDLNIVVQIYKFFLKNFN